MKGDKTMKNYTTPKTQVIIFTASDVITASAGVGNFMSFNEGVNVDPQDYFLS